MKIYTLKIISFKEWLNYRGLPRSINQYLKNTPSKSKDVLISEWETEKNNFLLYKKQAKLRNGKTVDFNTFGVNIKIEPFEFEVEGIHFYYK